MATSIDIRQVIDLPEGQDLDLYTVVVTKTTADGTVTGARIPLAQIMGGITPEPEPEPEPDPMLRLGADGAGFDIGPDGLPLPGQTITVTLEKRDIEGVVKWTINRDISIPEDATEVVISGDRRISLEVENVAPPLDVRLSETNYNGWSYFVTPSGEVINVTSGAERKELESAPEGTPGVKVTTDADDFPSTEFDNDYPPAAFYYSEGPEAQHLVKSGSDTRVYVRADVHGLFNMEHNDHALMTYFMGMSSSGADDEGNQVMSLQHIILSRLDRVREGVYSAILTFSAGELDQDGSFPFNYGIVPGYILPVNDPVKAGTRSGFTLDGMTFISVTDNLEAFAGIGLEDEEAIKAFLDAQDHHDGTFTAVGALPDPVIGTDAIVITVEAGGLEDTIELPVSVVTPEKDLVLEAHPTTLLKDAEGRPLIVQAAVVRAFPKGLEGSIRWTDNIGLNIAEGARKAVISASMLAKVESIKSILESTYVTTVKTEPGSSWWTKTGNSGEYSIGYVSTEGEEEIRSLFQQGGISLQDEVPLLPRGLEGEISTSFTILSQLDGSPLAVSGGKALVYIRAEFNNPTNIPMSSMFCLVNVRKVADGQAPGEASTTSILTRMHALNDRECSCVVTIDPGTFSTNTETAPIQFTDCMILPVNDPTLEGRKAKYNLSKVNVIPYNAHADRLAEVGVTDAYEMEMFFDTSDMGYSTFTAEGLVRNPAIDGTDIAITASVGGVTKSVMIPFKTAD